MVIEIIGSAMNTSIASAEGQINLKKVWCGIRLVSGFSLKSVAGLKKCFWMNALIKIQRVVYPLYP
jgi:hypothetical protein